VVPPASPLIAWISELNRWAADGRVRTVVPAHGPMGGRDLLRQTVAYLEGLRSGTPIEPQGPLSAFYRETHQQNLRWGSLTPR
jgi:hypothetical protein